MNSPIKRQNDHSGISPIVIIPARSRNLLYHSRKSRNPIFLQLKFAAKKLGQHAVMTPLVFAKLAFIIGWLHPL
jgi:hypothetical protein